MSHSVLFISAFFFLNLEYSPGNEQERLIFWNTETFLPGTNIFSRDSELRKDFDLNYSILVQARSGAANGRYTCVVDLKRSLGSKARFVSNAFSMTIN